MNSIKPPTVLVVEDEKRALDPIVKCLKHMRYRVATCNRADEVMPALVRHRPSAVLLDLKLPDKDGIAVLKEIKQAYQSIPVIVITGVGTVGHAVECLQSGAYDFLEKPLDFALLQNTLHNAIVLHDLQIQADRRPSPESYTFEDIVGISPQMQSVYRIISNVAKTDATVFVTGESGTGKELVARAIHHRSKRSSGPFIAVNCAAIPRDLLESELFGHEKGAFTGAIGLHQGCCEAAHGGTLFLDEICDMSTDLQVKLLRFLQDRTFQRVGGTETLTADVRLIAATNKDPVNQVQKGNFREDFYYRLMVVPIELKPLRDRAGDIPLLATHFLERLAAQNKKVFTGFSQEAMNAILKYPWLGNVRELENVMERVVVLHDGPTLTLSHLPSDVVQYRARPGFPIEQPREAAAQKGTILPLSEIVKRAIREAIESSDGDIALAAKKLDLPEETVREKAEEYGLNTAR
jgi:DNA-binding NtrC family response regulator